jgi:hypothetical protein
VLLHNYVCLAIERLCVMVMPCSSTPVPPSCHAQVFMPEEVIYSLVPALFSLPLPVSAGFGLCQSSAFPNLPCTPGSLQMTATLA